MRYIVLAFLLLASSMTAGEGFQKPTYQKGFEIVLVEKRKFQYPPFEETDTFHWTYQSTRPDGVHVFRFVKNGGKPVQRLVRPDRNRSFKDAAGRQFVVERFRWPLVEGASWSFELEYATPNGPIHEKCVVTVGGMETVVISGTAYQVVRVTEEWSSMTFGYGSWTGKRVNLYAPDVGWPVSIEYTQHGGRKGYYHNKLEVQRVEVGKPEAQSTKQ